MVGVRIIAGDGKSLFGSNVLVCKIEGVEIEGVEGGARGGGDVRGGDLGEFLFCGVSLSPSSGTRSLYSSCGGSYSLSQRGKRNERQ